MNEPKDTKNILDTVKMTEPIQRAGESSGEAPALRRNPLIQEVRKAVCDFLKEELEVQQVRVTKLVQIDAQTGFWEAEAEVSMPNTAIGALGLSLRKEVLDCQDYLLRLDGQLNIVAYGRRDLVSERSEGMPGDDSVEP